MTDTAQRILDELLQHPTEVRRKREPSSVSTPLDTDELLDVLRHRELLEALYDSPLDRRDLEAELDVSRATSHRFTRWLESTGYGEREAGVVSLTGEGTVVAEAVTKLERTVRSARRLAPLLSVICEDHRDFVVEPFEDATVTVATPSDPYAPVTRFLSLLRDSERFRGFNTTPMVPPGLADIHGDPFAGRSVELLYHPDVVERLRADGGERFERALAAGHLRLRTREAFPYGLTIFDDHVGVGGYDEETGTMHVFVDTDTAIARAWAERVYETVRSDSTPLAADADGYDHSDADEHDGND